MPPSASAPLAAPLPRQSGVGFLPPHHLDGARKRGAPYSSHRAPSPPASGGTSRFGNVGAQNGSDARSSSPHPPLQECRDR